VNEKVEERGVSRMYVWEQA